MVVDELETIYNQVTHKYDANLWLEKYYEEQRFIVISKEIDELSLIEKSSFTNKRSELTSLEQSDIDKLLQIEKGDN